MIVIYDDEGRIKQTLLFVAPSLEEYAATVLDPAEAKYLFWDGDDIAAKYVIAGAVVDRPTVAIGGAAPSQLDVDQLLALTVDQPVRVRVIANSQVIANEVVDDGLIELSFDQPGTYIVEIGGDFPIIETRKTFAVVR